MRRAVLFALSVAVIALSSAVGGTFAWFTDAQYSEKIFEVGLIRYQYTDSLIAATYIVPGQKLFSAGGALKLRNLSTVKTNLRFRIVYSRWNSQGTLVDSDVIYKPGDPLAGILDIEFVPGWLYDVDGDPLVDSGCFYYCDSFGNVWDIPESTGSVADDIPLFTNIGLNGPNVTVTSSGMRYQIKLIFQAKQAQFAAWTDIGTAEIDVL